MRRRRSHGVPLGAAAGLALAAAACAGDAPPPRDPAGPNVILCMTDDQGWGDVGYNGHPRLRTPHLDAMARAGVRFDRFYAGGPVCTPSRGSALTGRSPGRYGLFTSSLASLPKEETTLAEALRERGYRTGHFGKWHLGTLSRTIGDKRRRPNRQEELYAPPWEHGFDVCFSTEASVPTWNPLVDPETGGPYEGRYWTGPERVASGNLEGDDARVIMDRVVPFVRDAAGAGRPFLAVVWFHAPHHPLVAGEQYQGMYAGEHDDASRYWGILTAMDAQMGRLRRTLAELGIADDTMLFFCSDNGPALNERHFLSPGSAGPFRGGKGELFEGGLRVPGLLVWPAGIRGRRVVEAPSSMLDYFPTVLAALGLESGKLASPLDGIDLLSLLDGTRNERASPLGFQFRSRIAMTDDRYKLYSPDGGGSWQLYDLREDPGETRDVGGERPEAFRKMTEMLMDWRRSCAASLAGTDRIVTEPGDDAGEPSQR